ncbi:hypothetical protein F5Y17DRAFT_369106 [Xylariaceae sp. FL0594]|nr:hypothetical protein F5Y17DRAFT_369106 [Xylariaceae sp. FL0594]
MAAQVGPPQALAFLDLVKTLANDASTGWIEQLIRDNETFKTQIAEEKEAAGAIYRSQAKLHLELERKDDEVKAAVAARDEAQTKAKDWETEVTMLNKKLEERDEELRLNAAKITELESKLAESEKELQTKVGEHAEAIGERDQTISQHVDELKRERDTVKELQASLHSTETEFKAAKVKLDELEKMSCPLVPMQQDKIVKELDRVYNAAKALASKYFSEDLPDEVLAQADLFSHLGKEFQYPIPNSNSAAAKKARVAALLTDLGAWLSARVFVPFYTTAMDAADDGGVDDVTMMLSDLWEEDPAREAYLRKLLLATSPDRQREIALRRADRIAEHVWASMSFMFVGEKKASFEKDLRRLCRFAVDRWDEVRPVCCKVEPFMGDDEFDDRYWLPAELNFVDSDSNGSNNNNNNNNNKKSAQTNGNTTNGKAKEKEKDKPNGLASKASMHSLNTLNQLDCMWPGFYADGQVLRKGYMLLASQIRGAIEESSPYRHRSRRSRQRAAASSAAVVASGRRQHPNTAAFSFRINGNGAAAAGAAATPSPSPVPA